jgi:hypothetical protein
MINGAPQVANGKGKAPQTPINAGSIGSSPALYTPAQTSLHNSGPAVRGAALSNGRALIPSHGASSRQVQPQPPLPGANGEPQWYPERPQHQLQQQQQQQQHSHRSAGPEHVPSPPDERRVTFAPQPPRQTTPIANLKPPAADPQADTDVGCDEYFNSDDDAFLAAFEMPGDGEWDTETRSGTNADTDGPEVDNQRNNADFSSSSNNGTSQFRNVLKVAGQTQRSAPQSSMGGGFRFPPGVVSSNTTLFTAAYILSFECAWPH